ncbi:MAG TPA: methyltransferase, partial [Methylomirabilota bacterium]|nr:methyltransferase [Methylomirabilota bacterium]
MRSEAIRSVIRAYDDPVVRAYCWGRFWILRQRFLDEIGQYLPTRGRVLDLGCGFGLFSLYYASVHPTLAVEGFDRNARRIGMARAA